MATPPKKLPASPAIQVAVEVADVTEVEADVLILKYARGFHGADQEVALALHAKGKVELTSVDPAAGETTLVPTRGSIAAPLVLFVGTPRLGQLRYREVRELVVGGLASLAKVAPQVKHVALTLHGPNIGLDESQSFLSELRGLTDAIGVGAFPPHLERITFVERNANRAARMREVLELTGFQLGGVVGKAVEDDPPRIEDPDKKPHIFVAMPFAKETDDVFYYGIQKPVHAAGFLCERVDQVSFTGDIVERIVRQIGSAALVIAEVTGANPNVYLEIGYAWGRGVPTLLLARNPAELRFDVRSQRALFYERIFDLELALGKELERLPRSRPHAT
jgi:hypothetical protein